MSGNFKGFAMLRQMTLAQPEKLLPGWDPQHKPQPVYVEVSQPASALGYLAPCGSDSDLIRMRASHQPDLSVPVQGYGFVPPSQVPFSHLELCSSLAVRQEGSCMGLSCVCPPEGYLYAVS